LCWRRCFNVFFFNTFLTLFSLQTQPIKGSPYSPNVSGPNAHHTTASGPGVEGRGARIGQNAPFTVQSKDQNGNPVPTGNDPFHVEVVRDHSGPVHVDFKDNGNGTYTGGYVPPAPGFYTVTITLAGENIQGSPFHPLIEQGKKIEEKQEERKKEERWRNRKEEKNNKREGVVFQYLISTSSTHR